MLPRIVLLFLFLFWHTVPAQAAGGAVIIRDSEIEQILRQYSTPVFEAAGLTPENVRIIVLQNSDINAFVAGGQNIFIYTGTLLKTDTPEEIIGVIAHETGHIAGGHIIRSRAASSSASLQTILAGILGIGVAIGSGQTDIGAAILSGGQEIGRRSFLRFSRTQEASADQAALSYLNKAGLSPKGLLRFMQKLETQEARPSQYQDEYIRTHPLVHHRVQTIQNALEKSPYKDTPLPSPSYALYKRLKAKLTGFLHPYEALRHDPTKSLNAQYAYIIALYRTGESEKALEQLSAFLEKEPDNPFLYELQGQILFENGKLAEASDAYEKAVTMLPNAALIRIGAARALIELGDVTRLDLALTHLHRALNQEGNTPGLHRLLATAYGYKKEQGAVHLHLAEESLLQGKKEDARRQAKLALSLLPKDSSKRLRAQDILMVTE